MISIFGLDRPKLDCKALYCHYKYPKYFLKDHDIVGETLSVVALALVAISVVLITGAYIILRIRLKRKW